MLEAIDAVRARSPGASSTGRCPTRRASATTAGGSPTSRRSSATTRSGELTLRHRGRPARDPRRQRRALDRGGDRAMKLSVVIPAHNEEGSIAATVDGDHRARCEREGDRLRDRRRRRRLDATGRPTLVARPRARPTRACAASRSPYRNGFGFAVRAGLDVFTGDAVAIVMADGSDDPRATSSPTTALLEAGYDCAFGSRFMRGAPGRRLPALQARSSTGSSTSASGCCSATATTTRRTRSRPTAARSSTTSSRCSRHHFNLTVELPLKAVVRGHSYAIVPIRWTQPRRTATSKLQAPGDGQPLPVHRALRLPRAPPQPRRLPARGLSVARPGRWRAGRPGCALLRRAARRPP